MIRQDPDFQLYALEMADAFKKASAIDAFLAHCGSPGEGALTGPSKNLYCFNWMPQIEEESLN